MLDWASAIKGIREMFGCSIKDAGYALRNAQRYHIFKEVEEGQPYCAVVEFITGEKVKVDRLQ